MALSAIKAGIARIDRAMPPPAPALIPSKLIRRLRDGDRWERIQYFLRDERDQPVKFKEIHRGWLEFVERAHAAGLHAGVMAPFGHGKTAVLVIGLVLDWIGQNREGRFQIVSANDKIAVKRVGSIKRYIERSVAYHEIYPDVRPSAENWQKHEITIQRESASPDPTLQGYGITSGGTGSRSDGTAFDDVDDVHSLSPDVRETRGEGFDSTWMSRLESWARAVMPCTAWHVEDVAHRKLSNEEWAWRCEAVSERKERIYAAEIWRGGGRGRESAPADATGIVARLAKEHGARVISLPLWTERRNREALEKRERQSARAYRRGEQNDAYRDDETTFPSFLGCVRWNVDPASLPWQSWRCKSGVDLSSKKRPGNVIVVVGRDMKTGVKTILDVRIGAWTSPQTVRQIDEVDRAWQCEEHRVESNAYQESVREWAVDVKGGGTGSDSWSRISNYETKGTVHTDEYAGIPGLETEFSNGGWVFPIPHGSRDVVKERESAPGCGCDRCEMLRQVSQHPNAKQRDALMALWFARDAFLDSTQQAWESMYGEEGEAAPVGGAALSEDMDYVRAELAERDAIAKEATRIREARRKQHRALVEAGAVRRGDPLDWV